MTFITFIYKIGKNNKTYYGKYCTDYISDDHEGLDIEVEHILIKGINEYRKKINIKKLKQKIIIGIMSYSSNNFIPTDSSTKEIKCFDFYHDYDKNIYINGKII
jgi:hypothetical protein